MLGTCREEGVLPDGYMFAGLDLELSAGLTPHFVLSISLIFDFPAAPPFASQPKPLQLDA